MQQHHKIGREELSVREHMSLILRRLQGGGDFVEFETTVRCRPWACQAWSCTFLAMLELARETLVEVTQAEAFAPIYVRAA